MATWQEKLMNRVTIKESKESQSAAAAHQSTIKEGSNSPYVQDALKARDDILSGAASNVGWFAENWKIVLIGFICIYILLKD